MTSNKQDVEQCRDFGAAPIGLRLRDVSRSASIEQLEQELAHRASVNEAWHDEAAKGLLIDTASTIFRTSWTVAHTKIKILSLGLLSMTVPSCKPPRQGFRPHTQPEL